MAETDVANPPKEEIKTGQIVSAGAPVRADFTVSDLAKAQAEAASSENNNGAGTEIVDDKSKKPDEKNKPEKLTEQQIQAFYKEQGLELPDLKTLKEKLAPPAPELTDEQKKSQATELEKKLIAAHLSRGGTIEQYATFKELVAADPKEVGLSKIKGDLLKDGFTKDQVDLIVKKMHLQYTEEELAEMDDDQKKQLQKEASFGLKKQENRGKYVINQAKSYLDSLQTQVQDQDAELAQAAKHTSKVEDALKAFQRKQTLQLGEYDGQKLDPVEYNVSDDVLTEVGEILKDPAKFEKSLYNADGELNLDFLIPHLVASVSREKSVKHAFLSGQDKQVQIFKETYGSTIPTLGGPKKEKGVPGKIVGRGEPELMRRQ